MLTAKCRGQTINVMYNTQIFVITALPFLYKAFS